jgi:hypothetical protein
MKTKEEIEQLADEWTNRIDESYKVLLKAVYIKAYTQCQEDIEKEINSLKKTMIESSHQAMTWEEKYWQLKNSLNKQD